MRAALALLAALATVPALAQDYPSKTVRIVVHVTSGGLQDSLARAAAQGLAHLWGQPVIVENRPAAGGAAGAEYVARSAPDGYTLFQTGNTTILGNEFLRSKPLFDIARDFTPVVTLASADNILLAAPSLPANNVRELLALAKSKPGAINYGSLGVGSGQHVDTEALAREAGVTFTHIPYKGGAPLMAALVSGEVSFAFAGMTAAIPLVRQGRIKALAYGGSQRSSVFPDVPTLGESGVERLNSQSWFIWFAPAGTPRAVVDRIAADTTRVTSTPEFVAKHIHGAGHESMHVSGAKITELLDAERKVYAERIRPLNLRLD